MPIEDEKLLDLLQANQQDGILLLFERYYKPLVILADMYLKNEHSAEDVVQEQFIKFWDHKLYQQVKSSTALKNYLYTMVKNASLNLTRKNDILMNSAELIEADAYENTTEKITEEGITTINKAIAELPEQSRKVVVCVMVQNMKYQEAADELGVSINTVKTNLKRGVLKLREVLKDKEELLFLFLLSKRK